MLRNYLDGTKQDIKLSTLKKLGDATGTTTGKGYEFNGSASDAAGFMSAQAAPRQAFIEAQAAPAVAAQAVPTPALVAPAPREPRAMPTMLPTTGSLAQSAANGNANRDAKWAMAMENRSIAANAAATSADANVMQAIVADKNAGTHKFTAENTALNQASMLAESTRHNTTSETLTGQGLVNDQVKNSSAYALGKEKNRIDAAQQTAQAPVYGAQTKAYDANATESLAKAGLSQSQVDIRNALNDPRTLPEDRERLKATLAAESGTKGSSGLHVIPGTKTPILEPGVGIKTVVTPDRIVDLNAGTSREVKPAEQQRAFANPEEKLKALKGTPQQAEAELEYKRRYGALPKEY